MLDVPFQRFWRRNHKANMCHGLAIFRFLPTRAHPMDGIASGIMATCCWSEDRLLVMACIPFRPWVYGLTTIGQAAFPSKVWIITRWQYEWHHLSVTHDLLPILVYKKPWFYGLLMVFRLPPTLMEPRLKTKTLPWTTALLTSLRVKL